MTAATGDGPQPLGHRPALDGIRAMAILAVMALHAAAAYFPGGRIGVDVFFVLSAFLITSLILGEVESRQGAYDFKAFFARRALRLLPALLLWLALIAAPTAVLAGESDRIVGSTLASLLYVGNYAMAADWPVLAEAHQHVWSLAIEEQFYAVWPLVLVVVLLRRPRRTVRGWLWLGLGLTLVLQVLTSRALPANYFLPSGHVVPLAAGCLAAHLLVYGARTRLRQVITSPVLPVATVGLLAAYTLYPPGRWVAMPLSLGVAVLVLHVCWAPASLLGRLLALPVLTWIGRRSYGLYLYHRTLAQTVPLLVPGIQLKVAGPMVLLLSFAVAEASWRLVERPVQQAGRDWLRRRERR